MRPKDDRECENCKEVAREQSKCEAFFKERVTDRLEDYVKPFLIKRGMSQREVKASIDQVPQKIKSAISKPTLDKLFAAELPLNGFGLGGTTGGGKTMALAAILKTCATYQAKTHHPEPQNVLPGLVGSLVWASWPDEVSWLRSNAISPDAPERVKELSYAGLLVLDDLGRERIKGSYSDDWAASQLDTIINHRYREEKPILWTTNVTEMDLVNLYGAAMLRRLTADNPLIWIPDLKVMG